MSDFEPIPSPRGTHLPYKSMWVTAPVLALLGWGLSGLGLAAWLWRKAPLLDDRPNLPCIDTQE